MENGDVGIVLLEKEISGSYYFPFNPICLPSHGAYVNAAKKLHITSWGLQYNWNSTLQKSKKMVNLQYTLLSALP